MRELEAFADSRAACTNFLPGLEPPAFTTVKTYNASILRGNGLLRKALMRLPRCEQSTLLEHGGVLGVAVTPCQSGARRE